MRRTISSRDFIFKPCIHLAIATSMLSQGVPPEIPQHLEAIAPNQTLASARTITVAVTSRRAENPDSAQDLEHLRKRALRALSKTHFRVVSDKGTAELSLEVIVDPNVRYGMFHYQNAPYVYITVRETSSERLIYCSYQRAGRFQSASERLLLDFEHYVQHTRTPPHGSMKACAEQAMRPLT